ncbi:hypothetical protein D3H65_23640 [Paraflavitalea soli]|uniref:Uncharacterized protein n=1 Tax=Paraflavitalea soli TaxID=2315862 RepID=A0A3B7MTT5_9BACT|nr:hypothetical protein D3H65_23640 [Paraflavitalea soli]
MADIQVGLLNYMQTYWIKQGGAIAQTCELLNMHPKRGRKVKDRFFCAKTSVERNGICNFIDAILTGYHGSIV